MRPEDEINDDDPIHTQIREEAHDHDDEDADKDDEGPSSPEVKDNRGRD